MAPNDRHCRSVYFFLHKLTARAMAGQELVRNYCHTESSTAQWIILPDAYACRSRAVAILRRYFSMTLFSMTLTQKAFLMAPNFSKIGRKVHGEVHWIRRSPISQPSGKSYYGWNIGCTPVAPTTSEVTNYAHQIWRQTRHDVFWQYFPKLWKSTRRFLPILFPKLGKSTRRFLSRFVPKL